MTVYEMLPQRDLVKRKRQAENRIAIIVVVIVLALVALVAWVMGMSQ